jgi:cell division GTPase FtsZ
MEKKVFETQEFLRLIQNDENRRIEFLEDVIKPEGVIRIDMRDINRVLSCDGQIAIIKAEADNFETALNNLLINPPLKKDIILKAQRLLLSITTQKDLLLDDMAFLRAFLEGFKECTFDTWGLYKDANQTHNVSIICWAVGI